MVFCIVMFFKFKCLHCWVLSVDLGFVMHWIIPILFVVMCTKFCVALETKQNLLWETTCQKLAHVLSSGKLNLEERNCFSSNAQISGIKSDVNHTTLNINEHKHKKMLIATNSQSMLLALKSLNRKYHCPKTDTSPLWEKTKCSKLSCENHDTALCSKSQ